MLSTLTHTASRDVQLPQGTLQYREYGHGSPIVFIHGLLVSGTLWRQVVPSLATDYHCIVPELPLGSHLIPMNADADLSPPGLAQLILNFLTVLNLHGVILVANDTGGALTQILLSLQPDRVAGVVLTNCDAFENFLPPRFRYLNWGARVPGFVWSMAQLLRVPFLRRVPFAYGGLTKAPLPGEVLAHYAAPMRQDSHIRRDLTKVLRGISSRHTLAAAQRLRPGCPVLIVWGPEDPIFPLMHGQRLAQMTKGKLLELPNTYAFVPEDQPLRLAAAIRTFLEEMSSIDEPQRQSTA